MIAYIDLVLLHDRSDVEFGRSRKSASHRAPRRRGKQTCSSLLLTFRKTVYVVFSRQERAYYRNFDGLVASSYMLFALGALIGALFGSVALDDDKGSGGLPPQIASSQLAFGYVNMHICGISFCFEYRVRFTQDLHECMHFMHLYIRLYVYMYMNGRYMVQTASLKLFAADMLARDREESGGIYYFPYFLGEQACSHASIELICRRIL
jgi:hypothetical protein